MYQEKATEKMTEYKKQSKNEEREFAHIKWWSENVKFSSHVFWINLCIFHDDEPISLAVVYVWMYTHTRYAGLFATIMPFVFITPFYFVCTKKKKRKKSAKDEEKGVVAYNVCNVCATRICTNSHTHTKVKLTTRKSVEMFLACITWTLFAFAGRE